MSAYERFTLEEWFEMFSQRDARSLDHIWAFRALNARSLLRIADSLETLAAVVAHASASQRDDGGKSK